MGTAWGKETSNGTEVEFSRWAEIPQESQAGEWEDREEKASLLIGATNLLSELSALLKDLVLIWVSFSSSALLNNQVALLLPFCVCV